MTATQTESKTVTKAKGSYTIEADHPRNSDLLLQSIPNMRLRSRLVSHRPVIANAAGDDRPVPRDQAQHLGALPEIPGMQLTVDVEDHSYFVEDPLHENDALCEALRRGLQSDGRAVGSQKISGVPPQEGTLDVDRFKTLCREMRWLLDAKEAKTIGGRFLSMEQIDKLPGDYLLNPGSRVPNSQPRYEKDYEAWVRQVNQTDK